MIYIKKVKILALLTIIILYLFSFEQVNAESSSIIGFKDINLRNALCKYFNYDGDFTTENTKELSFKIKHALIDNAKISDLEGLQYL